MSFSRLKKARVELSVGGSFDVDTCPVFVLLVCNGCGKTDWFASPQAAVNYFGWRGERVDVVGTPPYR